MAEVLIGDYHVHSTFSDDAESSLAENLAAAAAVGLREIRLTDHVRQSTTWVPEFVAAVVAEPRDPSLTVLTGVEAKLLDASGAVDVPPGLIAGTGGLDAVVIGDHQFPGTDGPWSPSQTRDELANGLAVADALDLLIVAGNRAMESTANAQLAHWFSILPKVGLSEDLLGDDQLRAWAQTAARTGTIVEVNEKWGCPGPRAVRAAMDAGARVVASTDSHSADAVGRYVSVAPSSPKRVGMRRGERP